MGERERHDRKNQGKTTTKRPGSRGEAVCAPLVFGLSVVKEGLS